MPTSNHSKEILIGNFKTQSHVLCTAFFSIRVSKTTWNVLNCYVNWTNRFHVAVRLFSSRSHLPSKCGKECDRRTAMWNRFAQLSTGIARSRVQTPLKSWLFQASIFFIVIFLGHFCPRGKGAWGYPYVKHQPWRNNTEDSHNTGKLHALLFSNSVWVL